MEKKKIRLINVDACVTKQAIIEVKNPFFVRRQECPGEGARPSSDVTLLIAYSASRWILIIVARGRGPRQLEAGLR